MVEATPSPTRKRADARRNAETLLDAAASAFVTGGVAVPVREIAAAAGVGVGTIYRHQVDACVQAGPELLSRNESAHDALSSWIDLFVDFLVTKHGLAEALQSTDPTFETLHSYFLDNLVPVCADILDAAVRAGEIRSDVRPIDLMRAVGNLCIGAGVDTRYDARRMVGVLVAGLRVQPNR